MQHSDDVLENVSYGLLIDSWPSGNMISQSIRYPSVHLIDILDTIIHHSGATPLRRCVAPFYFVSLQ